MKFKLYYENTLYRKSGSFYGQLVSNLVLEASITDFNLELAHVLGAVAGGGMKSAFAREFE